MKQFEHRFQVNASLNVVSKFHSDTTSLRLLSPPPIFVQLHRADPMSEGSITDFTLWMGPIPIRWLAIHSDVKPLHGFTDTQADGPFKKWIHQHRFKQLDNTSTEVIDIIHAQIRDDLIYGLIGRLIWLSLPLLFGYRSWKTRRLLSKSN